MNVPQLTEFMVFMMNVKFKYNVFKAKEDIPLNYGKHSLIALIVFLLLL